MSETYIRTNRRLELRIALYRKGRAHPFIQKGTGCACYLPETPKWGIADTASALWAARAYLGLHAQRNAAWRAEIALVDDLTKAHLGNVATVWLDGREKVHDAGLIEREAGRSGHVPAAFDDAALAALLGAD